MVDGACSTRSKMINAFKVLIAKPVKGSQAVDGRKILNWIGEIRCAEIGFTLLQYRTQYQAFCE